MKVSAVTHCPLPVSLTAISPQQQNSQGLKLNEMERTCFALIEVESTSYSVQGLRRTICVLFPIPPPSELYRSGLLRTILRRNIPLQKHKLCTNKTKKKRVPLEVLNLYAPAILVSTLHSFNPLEKSLIHTWNIFKSIPEVSDCGSSDDFIGPTID